MMVIVDSGSCRLAKTERVREAMTKADLAELIYQKVFERRQISKADCLDLVDMVLAVMKDAITTEGQLKVAGFGVFDVRSKNDRRGRNPQTGEEMLITSRKVLTFKPSSILKDKINRVACSDN
jgi:integration host factor subunit alpha